MISERSGHIVNVASVAASFGIPGLAAYCASKYAMLGFSESLYHELHGTGVGISLVSPIGVKTNFFSNKSFREEVIFRTTQDICSNQKQYQKQFLRCEITSP